jgi:predicted amidohydrolase YtcJ
VNGARAAFEEADKGTLAVGKFADLVALADDPLTAPAAALASIPIELTMIAGRVVFEGASRLHHQERN